jgi:tRNA threonylcarbamoyladenosine biosynthesis protein TsaE
LKLTYHLYEVEAIAQQLIKQATSKTLLFHAEMGVGKTTLIKELVKAIGSEEQVSSPTYSLVNEYRTATNSIYHFDLYRIEDEDELYNFGIEEYLNSDAWVLVEWPDILMNCLSNDYNIVTIKTNEDESRTLELIFNS